MAREGFDLLTEMLLQIIGLKNHFSETSFVLYCFTVEVWHCHLSPFANGSNYVDFNSKEFPSEEAAVYSYIVLSERAGSSLCFF